MKSFKVSNDPQFAEKLVDVVGRYFDPPEHALILPCDEKSQIRARNRTQNRLPLFPDRLKTLTHDYKRNGTATLLAAIELAEARIIAQCMQRHQHQEWINFMKRVDAKTPADLDLIVDNSATHNHPNVQAWLRQHPRLHIHFTLTSSSWLSVIERWFRDITHDRIRTGVLRSVAELETVTGNYIEHRNVRPSSFAWPQEAEDFLEKTPRVRKRLN